MAYDRKIVVFSLLFFLAGLVGATILGSQGAWLLARNDASFFAAIAVGFFITHTASLLGFTYLLLVATINDVASNLKPDKIKSKKQVAKFDEL